MNVCIYADIHVTYLYAHEAIYIYSIHIHIYICIRWLPETDTMASLSPAVEA